MNRRALLGGLAGAALGAAGGCMPRPDPTALLLRGWAYEPDLVRANLARFARQPGAPPVDYAPLSGNYHDKMVALFVARTPLDVVYVRDDFFAEWVQAGWLQPIDEQPRARAYAERIFPFNREALTYEGRLYGLPYYGDFTAWIWNARLLEAAGYATCGATLEEIAEQCLRIKERRIRGAEGVIEYPLVFGFKQAALGFNDFWALMYASEVELFTPDLEPTFPDDPGRRAERVLQWLVDGIHRHRIIDLAASFTTALPRDLFAAGRTAMVSVSKYDLQRLNDPAKSSVAGAATMALYPSLERGQRGTLGWTRMYCIPSTCERPDAAWSLMEFLGGQDASGSYSTAIFWAVERGLGVAYPELLDDPAVAGATRAWGDLRMIRMQARYARARENIKAPWFPEFDTFYQAELQEVLQRHRSPRDGLARIARECRRLRREWA